MKLLSKSENFSENYLLSIIKVENIIKHPGADRLQLVLHNNLQIVTNMTTKIGDIKIYFPLECAIDSDYLKNNNEYTDHALNLDINKKGYFSPQGRVRAQRLRGVVSKGYLVPVETLNYMLTPDEIEEIKSQLGVEFDMVKDVQLARKYIPRGTKTPGIAGSKNPKESKLKDLMIPNQFRFHEETTHLGKNMHNIDPDDNIVITYKTHGSSCILSNVQVKRKLNLVEKILKKFKFNIPDAEYGYIYSSGKPKSRLVKNIISESNSYKNTNMDFYKSNIWERAFNDYKHVLLKGITLYGELLGYGSSGEFIQGGYDYGNEVGQYTLQIYRINYTNIDGNVIEFTWNQIKEFCLLNDLKYVEELYVGKAKNLFPELDLENHWQENFVLKLRDKYLEKDCHICKNKVPAEGIVVNKYNGLNQFTAHKLKADKFLLHESAVLDAVELTDIGEGNE